MTTAPTHLGPPLSHRHLVEAALIALLAVGLGLLVVATNLDTSSAPSTITGSGSVVTQVRSVPEFSAVNLAGANNVSVHVGEVKRVTVQADDNLVGRVTTSVKNGELVIGSRGSVTTSEGLRVDVAVPELHAVKLTGSGVVAIWGVRSERFVAHLAGSGVLQVSGRVDWLSAWLSGSGDLQLGHVHARHTTATIDGTGRILLNDGGTLTTRGNGTGAVVRR